MTQGAKLSQEDIQRYVDWCSISNIPRVTIYTPGPVSFKVSPTVTKAEQSEVPRCETVVSWARAEEGIPALVELAKQKTGTVETLQGLTQKYRFPDLLVSLGPSKGMPLCGLPPMLAGSAEVLYGGRRLSVLEFYSVLEEFARIEQRFGK